MSSLVNITRDEIVEESPLIDSTFVKKSGYRYIPTIIREAIQRGETFYLGVELYHPDIDEIWATPSKATFLFSDSEFLWQNRIYRPRIESIPSLTKFIGKEFNSLNLQLSNVQRGIHSGSSFVFKNVIRGYRVAVRIIFPDLNDVQYSRLIWWGRVATVEDLDESSVQINCSQEIGDFSYELGTQKYGSACPLFFGKGECLGNQTFEQKSLAYQIAFNTFGQGGCNRTFQRCKELENDKFYQGQRIITINGQFFLETVTKVPFLIFFKKTKKTITPVQYSSKNQSENDNTVIPQAFGRVQTQLHPITWVDVGAQIKALMGACKGPIEGFLNVICRNSKLNILDVTQHLGELGGEGTQQPDPRFPDSGYNSRLAYAGVTYGNSSTTDTNGEDTPTTTAVLHAQVVPVRNNFGEFQDVWSCNGVWITRFLLTNWIYTVIKAAWFNEEKNQETADYCFDVVEDDTNADVVVVTGSSFTDFQLGLWERFEPTGRFDSSRLQEVNRDMQMTDLPARLKAQFDLSISDAEDTGPLVGRPLLLEIGGEDNGNLEGGGGPDIIFGSGLGTVPNFTQRTYLALRYTTNGMIIQNAKLSDLLFSLVLPTFQGYITFNQFGKIEINCRKPADSTFLRSGTPVASTEIPVASVRKFIETYGWLLIGVGVARSEIARIIGIRYVNGVQNTVVEASVIGQSGLSINNNQTAFFVERVGGPAELILDYSGTVNLGDKFHLKFSEPTGESWEWDWYADSTDLSQTVKMFQIRLMASPSFRETFTAEIFDGFPNRIYIRCQTGYIQLDRPLQYTHDIGEEVLRVVEIYEDGKDPVYAEVANDKIQAVSGKVLTVSGNGINKATVKITRLEDGHIWTTLTNAFGIYSLTTDSTTGTYQIQVTARGNTFKNGQYSLPSDTNNGGLIFNFTNDGTVISNKRTVIRDNMKDFKLNSRKQDTFHGVEGTYISAIQDFRETQIQPRIAWDAAEQERNMNILQLDLRWVDNYRQAAFLIKSASIKTIDGNLPATFATGPLALFHEEGEVIAIRHQTMEGVSWTPFSIEGIGYEHGSQTVTLDSRLYLSAAFDERVAQEEKFLDTTLTVNEQPDGTPPPVLRQGGFATTGTGDGAADSKNQMRFETQAYETLPDQQKYSPKGRDLL